MNGDSQSLGEEYPTSSTAFSQDTSNDFDTLTNWSISPPDPRDMHNASPSLRPTQNSSQEQSQANSISTASLVYPTAPFTSATRTSTSIDMNFPQITTSGPSTYSSSISATEIRQHQDSPGQTQPSTTSLPKLDINSLLSQSENHGSVSQDPSGRQDLTRPSYDTNSEPSRGLLSGRGMLSPRSLHHWSSPRRGFSQSARLATPGVNGRNVTSLGIFPIINVYAFTLLRPISTLIFGIRMRNLPRRWFES